LGALKITLTFAPMGVVGNFFEDEVVGSFDDEAMGVLVTS
jgi:hypothetical protein